MMETSRKSENAQQPHEFPPAPSDLIGQTGLPLSPLLLLPRTYCNLYLSGDPQNKVLVFRFISLKISNGTFLNLSMGMEKRGSPLGFTIGSQVH